MYGFKSLNISSIHTRRSIMFDMLKIHQFVLIQLLTIIQFIWFVKFIYCNWYYSWFDTKSRKLTLHEIPSSKHLILYGFYTYNLNFLIVDICNNKLNQSNNRNLCHCFLESKFFLFKNINYKIINLFSKHKKKN